MSRIAPAHRFGRRHAFMLPGALATGPLFFLLFSPPRSLGHAGLFVWLLVCSIGVRVASAVYRIPYLSLGAEMSRDYDDRTSTMAIRTLFGLVGTLAAGGLSFLLFFPATADGSEPKLHYAGYPHLGLAFGVVMTVTGLIAFLGTLDYRTWGAGKDSTGAALLFRLPDFHAQRGLPQHLDLHDGLLPGDGAEFQRGHTILHLVCARQRRRIAGPDSDLLLRRRDGGRGSVDVAGPPHREAHPVHHGYRGDRYPIARSRAAHRRRPAAGHRPPLPLMIGHVVAGIFASAVWVVPAAMIADVTDTDELATGMRREGIYFGIMNFGEKIAAGGASVSGRHRLLSLRESWRTRGYLARRAPAAHALPGPVIWRRSGAAAGDFADFHSSLSPGPARRPRHSTATGGAR